MMNYSSVFERSPEAIAFDPEVNRIILEKVRFNLAAYISPALLRELQMRPDMLDSFSKDIAYRVEGVVYGKETRERVVERRTEKEKETKEAPEVVNEQHTELIPKTWRDHIRHTFRQWAAPKLEAIPYTLEDETIEDEDEPKPIYTFPNRLRVWYWNVIMRLMRQAEYRQVTLQTTRIRNVTITPITKHFEVHKHWHTCPHLNVASERAHIEFLTDYARLD